MIWVDCENEDIAAIIKQEAMQIWRICFGIHHKYKKSEAINFASLYKMAV